MLPITRIDITIWITEFSPFNVLLISASMTLRLNDIFVGFGNFGKKAKAGK